MSKTEFLIKLREKLSGLPKEEVADRLIFYGEMIDDRMEEGLTEEEAVSEIGSVDEIATQILEENPASKIVSADEREKRESRYQVFNNETIDISEDFRDIEINSNTEDVTVHLSNDDSCRVAFIDSAKQKHTVEVRNGTLYIKTINTGKWYDHIAFFSIRCPKIELYLPSTYYSSLIIKANIGGVDVDAGLSFGSIDVSVVTGDISCSSSASGLINLRSTTGEISIKGISGGEISLQTTTGDVEARSVSCAGNIEISVLTGDATLEKVSCRCATVNGTTGDVHMSDVKAEEVITAGSKFGDLVLKKCDALELSLNSNIGDISASLLTEKRIIAKSSLGDVRVPSSMSGGICKATTNAGDIKISIVSV